jgi:hypothetical protein
MSAPTTQAGAATAPTTPQTNSPNVWDFLRALCVLAALSFLTWYLVYHFGDDAEKATTVLGVIVPVFAAIVGVTLGYHTATQAGQAQTQAAVADGIVNAAQAAKAAEQQLAVQTEPLLAQLDQRFSSIVSPVERLGQSASGTTRFTIEADQPLVAVDLTDIEEARKALHTLRGMLAHARSGLVD